MLARLVLQNAHKYGLHSGGECYFFLGLGSQTTINPLSHITYKVRLYIYFHP